MMNGVAMAAGDDGNVDFGTWGGLNEITRYPEISANHSPSEYAFGGASSVVYKNTIASAFPNTPKDALLAATSPAKSKTDSGIYRLPERNDT